MSVHTRSLFRTYVHQSCKGVTKVVGDDYVMLENPFCSVNGTFCSACQNSGPLDDFAWSDSGQRISDYRNEIAAGVSDHEKTRLSTVGTIYEGALRLHLDRDGNPLALGELTAALSECVPPHFKRIRCQLRVMGTGDGRKLSVRISNPDRPEEMPPPSLRVDQAAVQLIRVMNPSSGPFAGLTVNMEQKDGRWRNSIKLKQV